MSLDDHRSDTGPFALIPAWLLDTNISDGALRQYALLARYADFDTGSSWPSRTTLANRQNCSTATVDRRNRELVDAGAITIDARFDDGGDRTTNRYTVTRMQPGGCTGEATGGDMGEATGGRASDAQNENHLEREPIEPSDASRPTRTRVRTPRDEVWDALVRVFGEPGTKNERSFYGEQVKQLVEHGPVAVELRAREARRRWPDCTVAAVTGRWTALAPRGPAPGSTWDDVAAADRERLAK